jgi:nucleotide-binding universal stress UspA family protein
VKICRAPAVRCLRRSGVHYMSSVRQAPSRRPGSDFSNPNGSHAIDRCRRGPEGVTRFIGAVGPSACISSALTITAALGDPAGGYIADQKRTEMLQPSRRGILVGVDGSAAALAAVRWAARDAALRDVPLTLVHVVNAPVPGWSQVPALAGFRQWQEKRAREFIKSAIKVAEESTGERGPLQLDSKVFYSATVPTLVGLSKEVEMVVVGYQGHGGVLVRNFLGSVSSGLVYHAHCPVAVIHDDEPLVTNVARAPVLVGIDGSPASEAATAIAFEEASRRGVGVIALHAWTDLRVSDFKEVFPNVNWDAELSHEEETLAERLAGWQERYPDVGIRRKIEIGEPARPLIEASEWAQLLVVGSHGRGGFAGMLLGSVGAAVVNRARIPVIVARQS